MRNATLLVLILPCLLAIAFSVQAQTVPTAGLLLWLKADALVSKAGEPVTVWTDASGNGRQAVFTPINGKGVAPIFAVNAINGKPAVRFAGNSLLRVEALPLGAYTIVAVFKTTAGSEMLYEHSDGIHSYAVCKDGCSLTTGIDSTISVKRGRVRTDKDATGAAAATWAAGAPSITVTTFDGTDNGLCLYLNGTPQTLNPTTEGNLNSRNVVTAHFDLGARAYYGDMGFHGDLAEVIVYDHALSAPELTQLQTTLQKKYGAAPPPPAAITVTDYNWLQLPAENLTASVGNARGTASNGYGVPEDFLWGNYVWIPDGALTANGTGDYWACVQFDQPRNVTRVRVQWWYQEGTGIRKYTIQGSADGRTWTDIGVYDHKTMLTGGSREYHDVPVTSGHYLAIRVYVKAGDYQYGKDDRGGPGLLAIEPIGSGTVVPGKVNWANGPTFHTVITNNNCKFDGLRYNDGYLFDDEQERTGSEGTWPPGSYAQLDLGTARTLNKMVVAWDSGWAGNTFNIAYSADGVTFTPVSGKSAPLNYNHWSATGFTFTPATARFWRITDAGGAQYNLLNQVMVYGP